MFAVPAPPVRHQQLLVTIFGLYGRNAGDALPVSALVSMLGTLGYDAPGVRSSVSRLKAKGVLKSVREGGIAKYKIAESVSDVFREGDRRIFAPEQPAPVDTWVLAVFSVPESMRNRRHQLRSALSSLGFGSVASGVWIAPAHKLEQARERLSAHVHVFEAGSFGTPNPYFSSALQYARSLLRLRILSSTEIFQHGTPL